MLHKYHLKNEHTNKQRHGNDIKNTVTFERHIMPEKFNLYCDPSQNFYKNLTYSRHKVRSKKSAIFNFNFTN
ncbi:hypothetical protein CF65_02707 [Aggregatibacter actinomycetemcomitans HK1651]|nr:hypothetical protein CF65_02707 [Aggregatibacter actinomycetemcomitans HK1651]